MVRNRKPCTKARIEDSVFELAITNVIAGTLTLRAAAESYGIPKSTLARAITKKRDAQKSTGNVEVEITYQPRWNNRRVFTIDEEAKLEDYLIEASQHHAGLTKKLVREFAYEYAKKLGRTYPSTWDQNQSAG